MKRKALTLTMSIALTIALSACDWWRPKPFVTDAKLSREVNSRSEAVDPTTTFDSADPVIHCVVKVARAPEGTKVLARWVAVKAEGLARNEKLIESDIVT